MSLRLYFHPLSSYCQKALIALYEHGIEFEPQIVDLGNETDRANFLKVWPVGKFPVLRDEERGRTVAESSIIIEYLGRHYPGGATLIPADAELALHVRMQDRFYDLHVNEPMQRIVADRLVPPSRKDPAGVEHARARLRTACDMIEKEMANKTWAAGESFSMADCAAAPALFYADQVMPFGNGYPNVTAYFERLRKRPSYARALGEAQPYFKMFPQA